MLLAAPSAAVGLPRRPLTGPENLRVAATTPHRVPLAWDPVVSSGSFTYVIEASFGYRVGVPQTQTSYTWTRDMIPGRTYSFVMWAGDAKGRQSAKSNTVTVMLPVDTTPPAATTHSFTIVAVDPWGNASAPSAAVKPTTDTTGPTAPADLSAWDFGCETWLFWNESVDDVDPQYAIRYEVRVNGVLDGAQTGIDRWITSARIPRTPSACRRSTAPATASTSSVMLMTNQAC